MMSGTYLQNNTSNIFHITDNISIILNTVLYSAALLLPNRLGRTGQPKELAYDMKNGTKNHYMSEMPVRVFCNYMLPIQQKLGF